MAVNQYDVGTPKRLTTSTVHVITSGPTAVLGVQVATVLTAQLVQFFTQTANSVTGEPVIGTMSMLNGTYYNMRGLYNNGLVVAVTNEDVDLTIYYSPVG